MTRSAGHRLMLIGCLACILSVVSAGLTAPAWGQAKSFQVSGGGTLEVKLESGDIQVRTSDRNEVTVQGEMDGKKGVAGLDMTQSGNTIRVDGHEDENGDMPESVSITVPAQFNLELQTSAGEVSVKGKLNGSVTAKTGGGGVAVDDVDGTLDLRTSGGDISTGTVNGDGRLETSGGDIAVKGGNNRLDVRTSGGNIQIGNVGKTLRAQTSGGDITIGDVGGEAKASTAGGNIHVGKVNGNVSLSTSGGDIELDGGTGTIGASTSGGNVSIKSASGSVDASSSGGDISAERKPTGKGRSKLTTAAGNIMLYLPEGAKASIDARIMVHGSSREKQKEYTIQSDFTADKGSTDTSTGRSTGERSSTERSSTGRSTGNRGQREIRAHYTLNGGGEEITLRTVNSDIKIRKLAAGR